MGLLPFTESTAERKHGWDAVRGSWKIWISSDRESCPEWDLPGRGAEAWWDGYFVF